MLDRRQKVNTPKMTHGCCHVRFVLLQCHDAGGHCSIHALITPDPYSNKENILARLIYANFYQYPVPAILPCQDCFPAVVTPLEQLERDWIRLAHWLQLDPFEAMAKSSYGVSIILPELPPPQYKMPIAPMLTIDPKLIQKQAKTELSKTPMIAVDQTLTQDSTWELPELNLEPYVEDPVVAKLLQEHDEAERNVGS